jgi:hypothetical protein
MDFTTSKNEFHSGVQRSVRSLYACCYRTVCAEIQYVGYLESCAGCEYCERHEIRKIIEGYDEKSVESIEGMKLIRVP